MREEQGLESIVAVKEGGAARGCRNGGVGSHGRMQDGSFVYVVDAGVQVTQKQHTEAIVGPSQLFTAPT